MNDPGIRQAVATLIGIIGTVVLMWGTSRWGPARRRRDDEDKGQ